MGSFVFKWPHPDAKDVHVTGTFDDWGKSEQLNKVGDFWEKEVNLPSADEKIYYKFVVDDNWVIDPTAPQEDDGHYNVNNVLLPKDIKKHAAGSTGAATAAAAAAAPSAQEVEKQTPGGFPETPGDEKEQSFGVAPIPASAGIGNPVNLPAGEKVPEPSAVTDRTVDSTASTSKEGYERDASAALPAAAGLAGAGGIAALVGSVFSKPEGKQNLIPESSLPVGGDTKGMDAGPHIQSAAPDSSTAALAAGVPLEKKRQAMVIDPADAPQAQVNTASGVPETVKESISEAHQSPEAAGSAEAVKEKSAMEQELLKKTTASEATGDAGVTPATQSSYYGLASDVPPTVEKSMQEAHAPPEAAADSSVVAEKSAMESELLKKVPSSEEAGEPAPTIAAATSEAAPATTKDAPASSSGLSTGEKIAGGAVGGMGAAGVVAGLASGKGKENSAQVVPNRGSSLVGSKDKPAPTTESLSKNEKVADSPGQTFGGGGAFHTDPVGTVAKDESTKKPETVEHFKNDPTHAEQSNTGASTGAAALGAGATGAAAAGAVGTVGAKSSAPAAAAAADGVVDPTLADEPAVKMMQQDEGKKFVGTAAHHMTTTDAPTSTEGSAAAGTTAASGKTAAPTSAADEMFAPHQGSASAYGTDAGGVKTTAPTTTDSKNEEKTSTMGPAGSGTMRTTPSASTTPVKKVAAADNSTSSPASSANTKDKKKRNRLSRLYHKIVD